MLSTPIRLRPGSRVAKRRENPRVRLRAGVANQGPLAVGKLSQLALHAGAQAVLVEFSGAFRDPEGDGLIGAAGVGASEPVEAAVFPARRQEDGINTGAAIRNPEAEATTVVCRLMKNGRSLDAARIDLEPNGQTARFIDEPDLFGEWFEETGTSDFTGSVHCSTPRDEPSPESPWKWTRRIGSSPPSRWSNLHPPGDARRSPAPQSCSGKGFPTPTPAFPTSTSPRRDRPPDILSTPMSRRLGVSFLLLLTSLTASGQSHADEDWIQLFNGKNLDGWIPKIRGHETGDNFGNTFRVKDGVMQVGYEAYEGPFNARFGHIFYERPFSHYRLVVEYRFIGDQIQGGPSWAFRNSGIMLHSQPPESMRRDQTFPICIEVQLLGGDGERERATMNLCTPGTHVVFNGRLVTDHCTDSKSKTYHGDQWVRAEVMVLGSSVVRHVAEGEVVLEYEMPQVGGGVVEGHDPAFKRDGELLESGYISLQSESHPVEFRKVELLNLAGCMDPEASNYKSYYVKSEPETCR